MGGGEHVLLHGGDWGADPRVEVAGREEKATVLSDTGLVFPLPGNGEAIVEGRVRNGQGVSRPFTLNAPTVRERSPGTPRSARSRADVAMRRSACPSRWGFPARWRTR